jgi:hypothetical protein
MPPFAGMTNPAKGDGAADRCDRRQAEEPERRRVSRLRRGLGAREPDEDLAVVRDEAEPDDPRVVAEAARQRGLLEHDGVAAVADLEHRVRPGPHVEAGDLEPVDPRARRP